MKKFFLINGHSAASILSHAAFFLYVVFLVSFLIFIDYADYTLGVLALVGLAGSIVVYRAKYIFHQKDHFFAAAYLGFVLVSIMALLMHPINDYTLGRNERLLTFLLILPTYYLFRAYRVPVQSLLVAFLLAGIFAGVVAIFQLFYWENTNEFILTGGARYSEFPGRPSASVNPMRFGAITLCMAVVCATGLLIFWKRLSVLLRVSLFAGSVFALVGCLLTQSRGSWLAVPFLFLAYLVYLYMKGNRRGLVLALIGGFVLGLAFVSTPQFQKRYELTLSSIDRYQQGKHNSSMGTRIDMAKAAWQIIGEAPVFGHGLGAYRDLATEVRENTPGMSIYVGRWKNPHNEILLVMVERGVFGLLSLVFLFGVLATIYGRFLLHSDSVVGFYSASGMGILIIYAVAGQTVALFEHESFIYFFASTHLVFVSQIMNRVYPLKPKQAVSDIDQGSEES